MSPLLALMRNQIAAAERAGIHAATINSTNIEEWGRTYAAVNRGEVDVLLLSPERLNNPDFRDNVMPHLAATCGLLVVDEAHCISDWGHDFRPDFRRLRTLLPELPAGIPVLATTATANSRVVDDVADVLGLGRDGDDVLVLRGSLDRESLHLGVLALPSTAHRLAWLADHLDELPGSGIIYTLTVAGSQEVADYLRERGLAVAAYSGQTEQTERLAAEDDLINNRVKALVATSALGHGLRQARPRLRDPLRRAAVADRVLPAGRPRRPRRRPAQVILLPGSEDQAIWDYFASVGFPREDQVRAALTALGADGEPMSTAPLETRGRAVALAARGDAQGARRRRRGAPGPRRLGRHRPAVELRRRALRQGRAGAPRRAAGDARLHRDGCLPDALPARATRRPGATDCGRCDNCGGLTLAADTSEQTVTAAAATLHRPGVPFDARRMWPTAMPGLGVDVRGKIGADDVAEPGRAIARFTDLGFGQRVRSVLAPETPDAAVPDDLIAAAIKVLASWGWAQRPEVVVHVGSARRPLLVADIAARLGAIGRLPHLGQVPHTGPSSRGRSNSAMRLREVWGGYAVPEELAAALAGRSVLLVDDYTDTGWTLTVVARLLRQAGAGAVYPFVLGIAG